MTKKSVQTKVLAAIMAVVMLLCLVMPATLTVSAATQNKVPTFEKTATKVYISEDQTMPVNIYFKDGGGRYLDLR